MKTSEHSINLLVIDLGNTDIKFGLANSNVWHCERGWERLEAFIQNQKIDHALASNVAREEEMQKLRKLIPQVRLISELAHIPIINAYKTPQTLGHDRLANAVAISKLKESGAALCIDIGTCLKFDFVDAHGVYQGGSIAPGLRMRFRALHEFTANLPHVTRWQHSELIGTDTTSSLISGVVEGMTNEINETIRRYHLVCEKLNLFLTGGDSSHFENVINYRIFADPNLTLLGLKLILEANV